MESTAPESSWTTTTTCWGSLAPLRAADGRTVRETLHQPLRYCHTSSGWVEISHLYPVMAKELRLRDKVAITTARRTSPLLAGQNIGPNTNRYGSLRNFSVPGLMKMSTSLLRTRIVYVLEGPTDEYLLAPWVAHLEDRDVTIRTNTEVTRIRDESEGAAILSGGGWQSFDAVVVTAFVSDATRLLAASGIGHTVKMVEHSHCKCFTVTLDPARASSSEATMRSTPTGVSPSSCSPPIHGASYSARGSARAPTPAT